MTMKPNWASDMFCAARVERLGHALGLRARIDVRDDRVFLRRVEVERLVHHAVEIGDAVVGLDRERLGKLEAGFRAARSRSVVSSFGDGVPSAS